MEPVLEELRSLKDFRNFGGLGKKNPAGFPPPALLTTALVAYLDES
jgi:hypothetical protein